MPAHCKDLDDRRFLYSRDFRFAHGGSSRHVPQLAYQTALAEKFIGDQHGDDGFFALVGNDGQLDLAFLEIEYGIRGIALRIHHLAFVISG